MGSKQDLSQVCKYNEVSAENDSFNTASGEVDLIEGDILNAEFIEKVCTNIDVIVHLAANTGVAPSVENPRRGCEINVIGTLNCLEAARKNSVKRFVFASSGTPAGECEPPIHEGLPPHPVSPYGASKLAGEGTAQPIIEYSMLKRFAYASAMFMAHIPAEKTVWLQSL